MNLVLLVVLNMYYNSVSMHNARMPKLLY